jgi:hypothetical protein
VAVGPDGWAGEAVKLDQEHAVFGSAADKHYRYDLEQELHLTQETRVVTIQAENAGGTRLVDVPATYMPRQPKLELHRGQLGVAPNPAAPEPKVTLTGRVTWYDDDKEAVEKQMALLKNGLRVYVNDFRQLRPRVSPGGRQGQASIEADVVLNRPSNEVKFECPGLSLGNPVRVTCKQPQKATLHLLVVDIKNAIGEAQMVQRVRAVLSLPEPGKPFPSRAFNGWTSIRGGRETQHITVFTQENTTPDALDVQLQMIDKQIMNNRSPADLVLICWVGPEAKGAQGQPALQWRDEDDVIPLGRLLSRDDPREPEALGARVLLLDASTGGRAPAARRMTWERVRASRIIRCPWAHGPTMQGLLEALEDGSAGERGYLLAK